MTYSPIILLNGGLCSWVPLALSLGLVRASTGMCLVRAGRFIGMVVGCIGGLFWGLSLSGLSQVYSAFVGLFSGFLPQGARRRPP